MQRKAGLRSVRLLLCNISVDGSNSLLPTIQSGIFDSLLYSSQNRVNYQ